MEATNAFLGSAPIGRLMGRYAVPCVISLLVGALYNIVDQLYIANASYLGSYGNTANTVVRKYGAADPVFGQAEYTQIPMAVVGIVMKLFQIVISVVVGTAAGCIPIVGFNMGAGKKARVRELFWKLPGTEAAAGAVGFALLLPRFWGLEGVLLSMPVSDALTFAAAVCLIRRTDRQLRIKEERTP